MQISNTSFTTKGEHHPNGKVVRSTRGLEQRVLIKLRNQEIQLEEGEFVIIPKGLEHLPVAKEEAHVLLLEPKSTINTGNVRSEEKKSPSCDESKVWLD